MGLEFDDLRLSISGRLLAGREPGEEVDADRTDERFGVVGE
nr:hypothetical protein [Nocardia africana]